MAVVFRDSARGDVAKARRLNEGPLMGRAFRDSRPLGSSRLHAS